MCNVQTGRGRIWEQKSHYTLHTAQHCLPLQHTIYIFNIYCMYSAHYREAQTQLPILSPIKKLVPKELGLLGGPASWDCCDATRPQTVEPDRKAWPAKCHTRTAPPFGGTLCGEKKRDREREKKSLTKPVPCVCVCTVGTFYYYFKLAGNCGLFITQNCRFITILMRFEPRQHCGTRLIWWENESRTI